MPVLLPSLFPAGTGKLNLLFFVRRLDHVLVLDGELTFCAGWWYTLVVL